MSRSTDPTLFLGIAGPDGAPLSTPLFGALHVTSQLTRRLRRLAHLCERERLGWLATRDVEPPVFWDASEIDWTEQSTTWHVIGTSVYAEFTARRRKRGGYGQLEVVGQTPVLDLAELEHLRAQRIILDFREHDGQDDVLDEPFALAVLSRLRETGVWPCKVKHPGDGE
jgi:hypothetical protein